MKIGYGRVSTADQNPDHQRDALLKAGVAEQDIYIDVISGSRSARPQLDLVMKLLRSGDQLVFTRLDRIGRSLSHLVSLGVELREREVELVCTEQRFDTTTSEGRLMFGMLAVIAEFQRDLIIANTRDGQAAARVRGVVGGRKPVLTSQQADLARRMYEEADSDTGRKKYTGQQIADAVKVNRSTLYGYLNGHTGAWERRVKEEK